MKEKPFYNMFPVLYWHKRSKYNPVRFIFGERYLSKKIPHDIYDTSDITITPSGDDVKDLLAKHMAVKCLNKHHNEYIKDLNDK